MYLSIFIACEMRLRPEIFRPLIAFLRMDTVPPGPVLQRSYQCSVGSRNIVHTQGEALAASRGMPPGVGANVACGRNDHILCLSTGISLWHPFPLVFHLCGRYLHRSGVSMSYRRSWSASQHLWLARVASWSGLLGHCNRLLLSLFCLLGCPVYLDLSKFLRTVPGVLVSFWHSRRVRFISVVGPSSQLERPFLSPSGLMPWGSIYRCAALSSCSVGAANDFSVHCHHSSLPDSVHAQNFCNSYR
ncbi:hypothetical protein HD554DRAFT_1313204 [Boletus coccyginus]|nr:hypothetical protein HD554DRAFT_1313204 [Boletus coccyginus]